MDLLPTPMVDSIGKQSSQAGPEGPIRQPSLYPAAFASSPTHQLQLLSKEPLLVKENAYGSFTFTVDKGIDGESTSATGMALVLLDGHGPGFVPPLSTKARKAWKGSPGERFTRIAVEAVQFVVQRIVAEVSAYGEEEFNGQLTRRLKTLNVLLDEEVQRSDSRLSAQSGASIALSLILDGNVWFCNIGDCRIMLLDSITGDVLSIWPLGNGMNGSTSYPDTLDLDQVGEGQTAEAVERDYAELKSFMMRTTVAEGLTRRAIASPDSGYGLRQTNCVGNIAHKDRKLSRTTVYHFHIDHLLHRTSNGQLIVALASDGLMSTLTTSVMTAELRPLFEKYQRSGPSQSLPLTEAAQQLVRLSLSSGADKDSAVLMLKLTNEAAVQLHVDEHWNLGEGGDEQCRGPAKRTINTTAFSPEMPLLDSTWQPEQDELSGNSSLSGLLSANGELSQHSHLKTLNIDAHSAVRQMLEKERTTSLKRRRTDTGEGADTHMSQHTFLAPELETLLQQIRLARTNIREEEESSPSPSGPVNGAVHSLTKLANQLRNDFPFANETRDDTFGEIKMPLPTPRKRQRMDYSEDNRAGNSENELRRNGASLSQGESSQDEVGMINGRQINPLNEHMRSPSKGKAPMHQSSESSEDASEPEQMNIDVDVPIPKDFPDSAHIPMIESVEVASSDLLHVERGEAETRSNHCNAHSITTMSQHALSVNGGVDIGGEGRDRGASEEVDREQEEARENNDDFGSMDEKISGSQASGMGDIGDSAEQMDVLKASTDVIIDAGSDKRPNELNLSKAQAAHDPGSVAAIATDETADDGSDKRPNGFDAEEVLARDLGAGDSDGLGAIRGVDESIADSNGDSQKGNSMETQILAVKQIDRIANENEDEMHIGSSGEETTVAEQIEEYTQSIVPDKTDETNIVEVAISGDRNTMEGDRNAMEVTADAEGMDVVEVGSETVGEGISDAVKLGASRKNEDDNVSTTDDGQPTEVETIQVEPNNDETEEVPPSVPALVNDDGNEMKDNSATKDDGHTIEAEFFMDRTRVERIDDEEMIRMTASLNDGVEALAETEQFRTQADDENAAKDGQSTEIEITIDIMRVESKAVEDGEISPPATLNDDGNGGETSTESEQFRTQADDIHSHSAHEVEVSVGEEQSMKDVVADNGIRDTVHADSQNLDGVDRLQQLNGDVGVDAPGSTMPQVEGTVSTGEKVSEGALAGRGEDVDVVANMGDATSSPGERDVEDVVEMEEDGRTAVHDGNATLNLDADGRRDVEEVQNSQTDGHRMDEDGNMATHDADGILNLDADGTRDVEEVQNSQTASQRMDEDGEMPTHDADATLNLNADGRRDKEEVQNRETGSQRMEEDGHIATRNAEDDEKWRSNTDDLVGEGGSQPIGGEAGEDHAMVETTGALHGSQAREEMLDMDEGGAVDEMIADLEGDVKRAINGKCNPEEEIAYADSQMTDDDKLVEIDIASPDDDDTGVHDSSQNLDSSQQMEHSNHHELEESSQHIDASQESEDLSITAHNHEDSVVESRTGNVEDDETQAEPHQEATQTNTDQEVEKREFYFGGHTTAGHVSVNTCGFGFSFGCGESIQLISQVHGQDDVVIGQDIPSSPIKSGESIQIVSQIPVREEVGVCIPGMKSQSCDEPRDSFDGDDGDDVICGSQGSVALSVGRDEEDESAGYGQNFVGSFGLSLVRTQSGDLDEVDVGDWDVEAAEGADANVGDNKL